MRLFVPHPHKSRIFLKGQRRGGYRLIPGLHHTSQQSAQAIVQNMNLHGPPLPVVDPILGPVPVPVP